MTNPEHPNPLAAPTQPTSTLPLHSTPPAQAQQYWAQPQIPNQRIAYQFPAQRNHNPLIVGLLIPLGVALLLVAGILLGKFFFAADSDAELKETPTAEPSGAAQAAELYAGVLDDIDSYQFLPEGGNDPDWDFDGYQYALTEINGDDIPEMLVQTNAQMLSWVRVFTVDLEKNEVIAPAETLRVGMASQGGFRGTLSGTKDGSGLLYTAYSSGTGEGVTEHVTLADDGELVHESIAEYRITETPQEIADNAAEIEYVDITDREPLEKLARSDKPVAAKKHDSAAAKQTALEKEKENAIQKAQAQGKQVFEGTVKILTYDEVLELQNIPDPNPCYDESYCRDKSVERYAILHFDQPTDVTAKNGDGWGYRTDSADMIKLAYLSAYDEGEDVIRATEEIAELEKYNNQQIVVAINGFENKECDGYEGCECTGDECPWWPSDVRIPVGAPEAGEYEIIWHE